MTDEDLSLIDWNTDKLFEAVRQGQTKNIISFLDRGANINASDRNGKTPLINAAQNRNYVVQKLLLSKGAEINMVDKDGLSALHCESAFGDVESIKLLITHGANINATNKDGRTPLHFAVKEGHVDAADMLVYCGADSLIQDTNGSSPISICTEPGMKDLMVRSQEIILGIKYGYIQMEHCVLKPDTEIHLTKVGLTLITPKKLSDSGINFLCRRLRPEYANQNIGADEKELLMSDTFDYRFSSSFSNLNVIVRIPMYTFPEPYEEVYLKTNRRPRIIPNIHQPLQHYDRDAKWKHWLCETKIEFDKTNVFVLVTRPKIEHFKMTPEGGILTSEIDDNIQIEVPKHCFNEEGEITLELTPKTPYRENEFEEVSSVTDFYDINHTEGEQPKINVNVSVPIPRDHDDDDDFFILRRTQRDSQHEVLNWDIIERNPNTNQGKITFETGHFSIFVGMGYNTRGETPDDRVMETDWNQTDRDTSEHARGEVHQADEPKSTTVGNFVSDKKIIKSCASLYEKAKRRECYVTFVTMLRLKEDTDMQFETLIDCVRITNLLRTIQKWKSEAFIDQKPSYPQPESEFVTFPKKMFNFKIGGNAKIINEIQNKLQYHPHRKENNFIMFDIVLKDESFEEKAWVEIRRMEDKTDKKLGTVTLHLKGRHRQTVDSKADPSFKGFTDDNFIGLLADQLGDEWTKIGVYLGLSGQDIRRIKVDDKHQNKKVKMLRRWRDNTRDRSDYGVRFLATSLKRCGRQDLVVFLQTEMRAWIEIQDNQKHVPEFCRWAKRSLSEDWQIPEGSLEPMSDSFLMGLVDQLGKRFELGPELGVSMAKLNDIEEDQFCKNPQIEMLELLIASRENHRQRHEAFINLDLALQRFHFTEQRLWMFATVEQWDGDDISPENTSIKEYVKNVRLMLEKDRIRNEENGKHDHLINETVKLQPELHQANMDQDKQLKEKEIVNAEVAENQDKNLEEDPLKLQTKNSDVKENQEENLKEDPLKLQSKNSDVKENQEENLKEDPLKLQSKNSDVKENQEENLKENPLKLQTKNSDVKENQEENLKEDPLKLQSKNSDVKENQEENLKEDPLKLQSKNSDVKENQEENLKEDPMKLQSKNSEVKEIQEENLKDDPLKLQSKNSEVKENQEENLKESPMKLQSENSEMKQSEDENLKKDIPVKLQPEIHEELHND